MSCGTKRGDFSPQKDTYSCKSNLTMSSWDPYPELKDPKNCYGNYTEGYCGCGAGYAYSVTPNSLDGINAYAPLQKSRVVNFTPSAKEKYCIGCDPTQYSNLGGTWSPSTSVEKYCIGCDTTPYDTLGKTWSNQGPYRA
jgi:hypothetical protein